MTRVWSSSVAAIQPKEDVDVDGGGARNRPVRVLVTGFGPFLEKYPINTSWLLAYSLPALIPSTPSSPAIQITVHPAPIRVSYSTVHSLIPTLLPGPSNPFYPAPDIILHIGLAAGRKYYTLERGAYRKGFGKLRDVDGEYWDDDGEGEKAWPGEEFPNFLDSGFDIDDAVARWRNIVAEILDGENSVSGRRVGAGSGETTVTTTLRTTTSTRPGAATGTETAEVTTTTETTRTTTSAASSTVPMPDLRPSPDAGNYLCGFIYWNSLAWYYSGSTTSTSSPSGAATQTPETPHPCPNPSNASRDPIPGKKVRQPDRPVAFLHVPDLSNDPVGLKEGKKVTVGLVRALVGSWLEHGARNFAGGEAKCENEEKASGRVGGRSAAMDVNFR